MKDRDLKNLLNRAAAALETPDDLSEQEKQELIEDPDRRCKRSGSRKGGSMTRYGMKIEIQMEPADRSVGIMSEGFAAWDLDGKAWCSLDELPMNGQPARFTWYDNETSDPCPRPREARYVESALLSYANAYYAEESEADDVPPLPPKKTRPASKFPESPEDWQLYAARECAIPRKQLAEAAKDLTEGLKKAIDSILRNIRKLGLKNPTQIRPVLTLAFEQHAEPPMKNHGDVGAWDTEPRCVALQAMNDAVKKEIGREGELIPELGEL